MRSGENLGKEMERRIRARNLAGVQSLFAQLDPVQRNWRNENGESLLHIAMSCHQPEIFEWLYEQLEHDFIVFSFDNERRSLVWLATKKHKIELAQRLLLNQLTSDRFTAEKIKEHSRINGSGIDDVGAQQLVGMGHEPVSFSWLFRDKITHFSVLHLAAQYPSSELLEFYIRILEDKNCLDFIKRLNRDFKTPLHEACSHNSIDCVVVLINHDAELYVLDKEQNNFFTWLENTNSATEDQKIELFKRLKNEKQLEVLSYGRRYFQDNEVSKVLSDKLFAARLVLFPESDVGAELNKFDQEKIKGKNQVLDEDRKTTSKLIKRVDDYLAVLRAKPHPKANHADFFKWLARLSGALLISLIVSLILDLVALLVFVEAIMPFASLSTLTFVAAISALTAMSTSVLLVMTGVIFPIACVILMVGLGKLTLWLDRKAKSPVVKVNKAEFSALVDDIDTTLIQKCNELVEKQGLEALPVSRDDFVALASALAFLKLVTTGPITAVESSFRQLKKRLENFQNDMTKKNKPFSEVHEVIPIVVRPLPMQIMQPVIESEPQQQLQLQPEQQPQPPLPQEAPLQSQAEQVQTLPAEENVIADFSEINTINIAGHWASLHVAKPEMAESGEVSAPEPEPRPTIIGMDADIGDDEMLAFYAFPSR